MLMRATISLVALIGVLCATLNGAGALDETKYPDWKGQWVRADSAEIAPWDSRKPWGLGQQPPLTPQDQAVFEANLKQLAAGVKASDPTARCIPAAMPRARPHSCDDSGITLHSNEQAVIRELISLDECDLRLLRNEITTSDNALSKPWSLTQSYRRAGSVRPVWTERI